MPERVDAGLLVGAIGALVLLISLFLDWYEPGFSAWTVFELVDMLLAAIAVATLLAFADAVAGRGIAPVSGERALAALGMGALVLVVVSIVNNPPAVVGASEELGAWLGLAGTALMCVGALLTGRRISIEFTSAPRRPAAPPPPPAAHRPTGPALEPEGSETETRPDNPAGRS